MKKWLAVLFICLAVPAHAQYENSCQVNPPGPVSGTLGLWSVDANGNLLPSNTSAQTLGSVGLSILNVNADQVTTSSLTSTSSATVIAATQTGTNVSGSDVNLQPGNGTGTGGATGSRVVAYRAYPTTSGTGAQAMGTGLAICAGKVLSNTSATATAIANFAPGNNTSGAAYAIVSVQCNDGTNFNSDTVTTYTSYVNKAGVVTVNAGVTTGSSAANNSGSCTVVPSWVANGATVDLKVTPVFTTIVPTFVTSVANINVFNKGVLTCK